MLRDRRVARELVACHAKILAAAGALSDHGSPRQVCSLASLRSRLKKEDPSKLYEYYDKDYLSGVSDLAKDLSFFEFQIDAVLKQYGRPYFHGFGSCAVGYTYAGRFAFDKETLSSTYPDFYPYCRCGNTCCVPSDNSTNGTARAAAGG